MHLGYVDSIDPYTPKWQVEATKAKKVMGCVKNIANMTLHLYKSFVMAHLEYEVNWGFAEGLNAEERTILLIIKD